MDPVKQKSKKECQLTNVPVVSTYFDTHGRKGVQITGEGGFNSDLFYVQIPYDKFAEMMGNLHLAMDEIAKNG